MNSNGIGDRYAGLDNSGPGLKVSLATMGWVGLTGRLTVAVCFLFSTPARIWRREDGLGGDSWQVQRQRERQR